MIRVFCNKRGSGKTKRLIELANKHAEVAKVDSVFIDSDSRNRMRINRNIRFVDAKEFGIGDCEGFYGIICGIISENYDVENLFIDELLNIVSCNIKETALLFQKIRRLSTVQKLNVFINIDCEDLNEVPEFLKKYVA